MALCCCCFTFYLLYLLFLRRQIFYQYFSRAIVLPRAYTKNYYYVYNYHFVRVLTVCLFVVKITCYYWRWTKVCTHIYQCRGVLFVIGVVPKHVHAHISAEPYYLYCMFPRSCDKTPKASLHAQIIINTFVSLCVHDGFHCSATRVQGRIYSYYCSLVALTPPPPRA